MDGKGKQFAFFGVNLTSEGRGVHGALGTCGADVTAHPDKTAADDGTDDDGKDEPTKESDETIDISCQVSSMKCGLLPLSQESCLIGDVSYHRWGSREYIFYHKKVKR